jgi:predicted DNA-binding protein (UPF0251 family)
MPAVTVFKPQGVPMSQLSGVAIGLDGFEALRLVDAEGLSQEEAAARMGVSRPTLCRILGEARSTVARALSRGWAIRVELEGDHAVGSDACDQTQVRRCPRDSARAGGVGRNRGGRSCQDREDKAVAEDKAGAGARAADAVDGARVLAAES